MNVRGLIAGTAGALLSSLMAVEEGGVDGLLEDLGHMSYPVREAATYKLWELGTEARDALEQASLSENPEVAMRARGILWKVKLGILPDSPPEVVDLVVRYSKAGPDDRQIIVRRLKRLRAWRQVLRIHELETDAETLAAIEGELRGVAVAAAREILAQEEPDFDRAREVLGMGRATLEQRFALADFCRVHGSWEEELEKVASPSSKEEYLWKYVLLAVADRPLEAAEAAEEAGLPMVAARFRGLAGDPTSWVANAPLPPQQLAPDFLDRYRVAVRQMWEGKPVSKELVRQLTENAAKGDEDSRLAAIGMLYALGVPEPANQALEKVAPTLAFFHYENTEAVDDALRALGLDPTNPDYPGWVKKRFAEIKAEPGDAGVVTNRLACLGWFLDRRGMDEVAEEAFVGPLGELAKGDEDLFLEVCGEMFSSAGTNRVVKPVIKACVDYAGDDRVRILAVRDTLMGKGNHITALWQHLDQFDPGLGNGGKMEVMAVLLSEAPDDPELAASWWKWVITQARQEEGGIRKEALAMALVVSAIRSEGERFLEAASLMRELGEDFETLGNIVTQFGLADYEVSCLSWAGRWDEVVGQRQDMVSRLPANPVVRAYLAGSLRSAGREADAVKQEEVMERLALGSAPASKWIAKAYTAAGDFGRAKTWWRRSFLEETGQAEELAEALVLLLLESMETGDWETSAALGEMRLFFEVMVGDDFSEPWMLLRKRTEIETARGMTLLKEDRKRGVELLTRCHDRGPTDGSMADYFFPALRSAGLTDLHDRWFEQTWAAYDRVIERFPGSYNTRNTAAWTASRANRRLDEAHRFIEEALEGMPDEPAYLDTYAEIWFARRDREKAVEWSNKAKLHQPGATTFLRQFMRFRDGDFPLK